jgi:GPH family glycoside/pentoside/hexuronide:cation symporter
MVLLGLFGLFFYSSVMGMPAAWVGVGFAAGLGLDVLIDPYIGYRSDSAVGRLGRRHGFMLAGALAMGPCFFVIFSPPRNLSPAWLFVWLLASSFVFRAASAIYRIPYLSLGAELSSDYDERTRVIAIRSLAGLAGLLAAAGLSSSLFFRGAAGSVDPKFSYTGYPLLGLVFGAAMTATGLIAVWGTWPYRSSGQSAVSAPHRFWPGFKTSMANAAFRSVWLSFTLFLLAVVLNATVAMHYFTWYAGIHEGRTLSAIQVCFGVGALFGVVLWMGAAKRFEKRTLYAAGAAMTAAVMLGAIFLTEARRLLGGENRPLMIGHAMAGLFASALWVVPASMLADIADQDELATGFRREGAYFGLLNLGEKLASMGAVLLAGLFMHFFVRLQASAAEQPASALQGLGLIYGVIPAVLVILAVLLIRPYHLGRVELRNIQQRLEERSGVLHG